MNDANIQLMREDVYTERKKIVVANMPLTDTEATKFSPVYDRYIADCIKVSDVRFARLKEYPQNYKTTPMSKPTASLSAGWLSTTTILSFV